jgi:hypothetical protein
MRKNELWTRCRQRHDESREQQSVVLYFRSQWPDVPVLCATRGKQLSGATKWARMKQGALIKREGYQKGTADLLFCVSRRGFHGLFLEMKKTDERWSAVSPDQRIFLRKARKQGYFGSVAFGDRNAKKIIDWYMNIT